MSPGVCGDTKRPDGMPTAEQLRAAHADGIRIQAHNDVESFRYLNMLARSGFRTAVVLDSDAFPDDDYYGWAYWYALNYAAELYVFWNEMDANLLPPSEEGASGIMAPEDYRDLFNTVAPAIRQARPTAKVLIGGLVSGQPDWLGLILPLDADGVDIHPYNKGPDEGRHLLHLYQSYGLPLYALEWHRPTREIVDFGQMLCEETEWNCWFCWHDYLGMGLVDDDGNPKPEYEAFQAITEGPMRLEEAEKSADWVLGDPYPVYGKQSHIDSWGPNEHFGRYTWGIGYEAGGEVWQIPHVGPGGKFRLTPV